MYSSVATVKQFAGITGNLNISTASITTKIGMADGIINGKIFDAYVLPLSETPAMIENISAQLAAAMILLDEYGVETEETDKDGEKMWERALAVLEMIQKRELKIISDTTGTELSLAGRTQPSFSPNNITQVATDTSSTVNKFSMNDVF